MSGENTPRYNAFAHYEAGCWVVTVPDVGTTYTRHKDRVLRAAAALIDTLTDHRVFSVTVRLS